MDVERARFNMVEQQIRTWEVLDQAVLDTLYVVRREQFVPPAYRALAFSDLEVPIGAGERMMQPKLEARILQELALKPTDRVLEVGTGSGYMAALAASRASEVITVEIEPTLKAFGEANLKRAGILNVTVETGDASRGWPARAPYDAIIVTGSMPILPQTMLESLRSGGRLFAVIGDPPVMFARLVSCIGPGSYSAVDLFETHLAPLKNTLQPKRFKF